MRIDRIDLVSHSDTTTCTLGQVWMYLAPGSGIWYNLGRSKRVMTTGQSSMLWWSLPTRPCSIAKDEGCAGWMPPLLAGLPPSRLPPSRLSPSRLPPFSPPTHFASHPLALRTRPPPASAGSTRSRSSSSKTASRTSCSTAAAPTCPISTSRGTWGALRRTSSFARDCRRGRAGGLRRWRSCRLRPRARWNVFATSPCGTSTARARAVRARREVTVTVEDRAERSTHTLSSSRART